jgi:hypothetical protein
MRNLTEVNYDNLHAHAGKIEHAQDHLQKWETPYFASESFLICNILPSSKSAWVLYPSIEPAAVSRTQPFAGI